jgi:YbbR domain-containing protein
MRWLANERILYFFLSLVFSVVMWVYVAIAQNPVVERILTVDLHVRGLSSSLVIVQPPPGRVTIRLQGPRSQIAQLTPSLLEASVNLYGLGPGDHRVPVEIATPLEVQVLDRTPAEVPIVLDQLAARRIPVQIDLIGTPPEGVVIGTPRVSPPTVLVSGAANVIGEVRQAHVSLDTTDLHQPTVASLAVRLVDVDGQEVRGLTAQPSTVEVNLPVHEGVITKIVPIVPTITGTPPPPLAVTGAITSPETVAITGPGTVLRGVQEVTTVPVDISRARGDVSRRVRLQVPGGVAASIRLARVVVHIGRPLLSTLFKGVPVKVLGVAAGTSSEVSPAKVDVLVEGPQDLIAQLKPDAVTVVVDATGWAHGEYTQAPRAVLPEGVRLLSMRPVRVHVILRSG